MLLVPVAGAQGNLPQPLFADLPGRLLPQHLGEEWIVLHPFTDAIQRDQKHITTAQRVEQMRALAGFEDRIAERGANAWQQAGLQEKLLLVRGQRAQDLAVKVVLDAPVAAGKCRKQSLKFPDVGEWLQLSGEQAQSSRPASEPLLNLARDLWRERERELLFKKGARLLGGERQVRRIDLQQLVAPPQARQREGRVAANKHHQVQRAR